MAMSYDVIKKRYNETLKESQKLRNELFVLRNQNKKLKSKLDALEQINKIKLENIILLGNKVIDDFKDFRAILRKVV